MAETKKSGGEAPDASLEEDFLKALHASFRESGPELIGKLTKEPGAYLRLIARVRDKRSYADAIDRMTEEELDVELERIEERLKSFPERKEASGSEAAGERGRAGPARRVSALSKAGRIPRRRS